MPYFKNKPAPTPGPQLPRPKSSSEAVKEELRPNLKRKLESIGGMYMYLTLERTCSIGGMYMYLTLDCGPLL